MVPVDDGSFVVGIDDRVLTRGDAAAAVAALVRAVADETRAPWFGSRDELVPGLLNSELARRGSSLESRMVQQRQWTQARVQRDDGRFCTLDVASLRGAPILEAEFPGTDGGKELAPRVTGTVPEVAEAIIAWATRRVGAGLGSR